MAQIKIDFRKPVTVQLAISTEIKNKMSGNLHFVAPVPTMADLQVAIAALAAAYNAAANGDREKKANMRTKRKLLHQIIVRLALYVQNTSNGDETIILSSGFGVRRKPASLPEPERPIGLKVKTAIFEDELEIKWEPAKYARHYIVEITEDPLNEENFKQVGASTKAKMKIPNLRSGAKYWFRVMAVNAKGSSGWSGPASGRTV